MNNKKIRSKRILISILAILMVMTSVVTVPTFANEVKETAKYDDEKEVYFKDGSIRDQVIQRLRNYDIRKKHLKEIKHLSFIKGGLKYFDELLLFPNLETLTIYNINDYMEDVLGKITNLKELSIGDKNVNFDISKITGLKNLERLSIRSLNIKNIEDIAKFPKLKKLTLWGTNFDDISKIKNLSSLTDFILFKNRNKVSEIKNLHLINEQGRNLKALSLCSVGLSNNNVFKDLVNLEYLNLRENNFDNLDFIKSYPKLKSLNVAENNLMDISIFKGSSFNNDGVFSQIMNIKVDKRVFELPQIVDAKGKELPVRMNERYVEHLEGRKYRIKDNIDEINDYCIFEWGDNNNLITDFRGKIYIKYKNQDKINKNNNVTVEEVKIGEKATNSVATQTQIKPTNSSETQTDNKELKDDSSQTEIKDTKDVEVQTDKKATDSVAVQTDSKKMKEVSTQTEPNVCMPNEKLDNLLKENKNNLDIIKSKDSELTKLKEDLHSKLKELEIKKGEIENLKDKEGQSSDELSKLENRIKILEEEKNSLSDKLDRLNNGMPSDISLNHWYPEKIIKLPNKLSYKDNDDINLNGLSILFSKYVKENGKYKKESSEVRYEDFRNGFGGWDFNLKTKKALLSETINGRMKIKFSFIYND